jgi:predicted amidohydrolase YtcJ
MVSAARERGYRLEVHAIGDAAAEAVLNAFDTVGVTKQERAILTHCQVLGPDLIKRMSASGVIANVQPSFVPTDMRWVQNRLTDHQQRYSYAWKTLMKEGVIVAGGSDAPIETCSPLVGLHDAIFRASREDPPKVFGIEERLSFAEALWTYTIGAAITSNTETVMGKLEKGFVADFIVVDPAVCREDGHSLLKVVKPSMVVVGGKVVYSTTQTSSSSSSSSFSSSSSSMKTSPGPFVPGKGGKFRGFRCACLLKGKQQCSETILLRPKPQSLLSGSADMRVQVTPKSSEN